MKIRQIVKGIYGVPMGNANAFLIEDSNGLVLIDAGYPGKQARVFEAIHQLGSSLKDLKHLIFTHAHPDHIGSAREIVAKTGARTYMHALDCPIAESGGPFRPLTPAPGILHRLLCSLLFHPSRLVEPIRINERLKAGDLLPLAGGIEVIHVPGHCEGQVALLMRKSRVLFAGDVATNILSLGDPIGFENLDVGRKSQRQLSKFSFEIAAFGHGEPIRHDASTAFQRRFH